MGDENILFFKYVAIETILRMEARKFVFVLLVGIKKIRVSAFLDIQSLRG